MNGANTATTNITLIPAKRFDQRTICGDEQTRVAAYCRVSTEQENQQNSYATQIAYYTEHINSNPNWKLVGIYADEGISGTQTANRTEFNKMIRMAKRHKIDLILCKSISRFARNTVDCLEYVRQLKALGVTVIFEKENINTSSMTSEFAISLYASFAQAESESISKNITWGIEKQFKEGKVRYNFRQMLGYRLGDDGVPVIVENEAKTVRLIFKMYADGCSSSEIAKYLHENGYKRWNGETNWRRNHIYQILQNEKYVGDAVLQKTYTVNCITHERADNNGQKPKYYIKDCHPAIIDRDTFDKVKLELAKRRIDAKRGIKEKGKYHTKYCLSRLMVCPYCGARYKRTTWLVGGKKKPVWRCESRLSKKPCPKSVSYYEEVLHKNIISAVNRMIENEDTETAIKRGIEKLQIQTKDIDEQIAVLIAELNEIEQTRDEILECISGSAFEQMGSELKELNTKEKEITEKINVLQVGKDENRRILLKTDTAATIFENVETLMSFDETVIDKLVEKIEAVGKEKIAITFCGGFKVMHEFEE